MMAESREKTKEPLDEGDGREWKKASLKLNIKKAKIWHLAPLLHGK